MFKRNRWDKPFPSKLSKRVEKIPTVDMAAWADQAIYELGRCLSSYERTRDKIYLDEALNGAEALHAVITEYHKRNSVV